MEWNEEPVDDVDPLAARDEAARQASRPRRPRLQAPARPTGGSQVLGSIVDYGRMAAGIGAAAQGAHLGSMISQVQNAIQRENDSRVAQAREMRRMQHEKDMKRMELDAMLARIQQARG